ncbi:hypothetical protein CVAR_0886 [Corynebacterium variabile DSM 44702]|uniref:Uncharacterized protein n=1 Tax=Corynebacterium variabile (strain DSM 44702 / CIP 107183 / JCM 12073 / NCIMB 30131) TaxID=858619 RepID=G0HC76_CORVD|nr:hypothetical protein CVAR_0886 [Corynebacterium variabile DSM 44702]
MTMPPWDSLDLPRQVRESAVKVNAIPFQPE